MRDSSLWMRDPTSDAAFFNDPKNVEISNKMQGGLVTVGGSNTKAVAPQIIAAASHAEWRQDQSRCSCAPGDAVRSVTARASKVNLGEGEA